MSKTYRTIPHKWTRRPKYKHKLLAGDIPRKQITTDWEDKPIAALKEVRGVKVFSYRFPSGYRIPQTI